MPGTRSEMEGEPRRADEAAVDAALARTRAGALRDRFPGVWPASTTANGPTPDEDGWASTPVRDAERVAKQARVRLPARADEAVVVEDRASGLAASFRLLGARAVRGAPAEGLWVFAAAGPHGGDVAHRVAADGLEDYIAFDLAPAEPRVEYELDASALRALRLFGNVLELVDVGGIPRLRVAPPYLVDARGVRHVATLSVEGCAADTDPRPPWSRPLPPPGAPTCRVGVSWEGAAVAYPALLDPSWGTTGSMFTPRRDHTATRLASGEVLVVGGFDFAGNGQTFAERYLPPPFGVFTVTGPMQIGRGQHTETMLAGSPERVLVTGGAASASGAARSNAELYDVTTGTFGASTIPMTEPRKEHTATLLQTGRVLVAGGSQSAVEPRQAELFDPATQQFSTTAGKMSTGRHAHTAVALPDGKVLVAGGFGTVFALATTEVFDPGPATFSAGATMTSVRAYATATLLKDNRALIAGGTNGSLFYSTADVYDPAIASFTQTIPMAAARAHHAATILETGRVILTGGEDAAGAKSDTEAYDPTTGGFAGDATMNDLRAHHTATLLDSGKVLVAGGTVGAPASSAEVLLRANGDACAVDGECESSHCVLGMCCDTTCTGLCTACTADDKGSGVDGECGPVIAGKAAAGPGTIGCESDINFQIVCDGLGGVTNGTIKDCKPFACVAQACLDSCTKPEDCTATAWCRFVDNTCIDKSPNGTPCGDGVECTSGFCADGVCCNDACDGSCEACNRPEAPGTCGAAPAGPAAEAHPACPGTEPCVGVCDGQGVACTFPPIACGDASTCVAGEETSGQCQDGACAQVARSCNEFACDAAGVSCRTACKTTDECATGYLCTADGKCAVVDAATCDGSVVRLPNGGTDDCSPFGCEAGACRASCSSVNDCAPSFVCDPKGRCVAPPAAPTLPDACAVGRPGGPARGAGGALAALALFAFASRRKRRGSPARLAALAMVLGGALIAAPARAQPTGKPAPGKDAPAAPSGKDKPGNAPQAKDPTKDGAARTPKDAPTKDGAPPAAASTGRADEGAADAAEEAKRKDEARVRFERGVGLFEQQAWTAALAEFLASRGLFATRAATKNAAVCLRKLERFDEALDMFEALLREYPNLPPADKTFAQREVTDLRVLVATIDVDGAEPGASVVIDGRSRADFPLVAPLRVPAGTHIVRVFKEGFEPFETRVDVPGGQRVAVTAKLKQLTAAGRLRVGEKAGRALDVLVDGAVVGRTPWEGQLGPGNHVVVLRGEGTLGTEPAAAAVKDRELTNLLLAAEPLEASLLVTATPSGAGVSVNSVAVGHGVWDGRLRAATHTIEVAQDGFVAARQQVALGRGERKVLKLDLERDPDAAIWKKPSHIVVEAAASFGLAPSFGGDVAGCSGTCSSGVGVGVLATARASYELGSGLGFGVAAGYLLARQGVDARTTELAPQGLAPISGTVDDELLLKGFVLAATGGVRLGERFPVQLRLGAGALLAQVRDARTGRSSPAAFPGAFPTAEHGDLVSATYLWLDPEVRVALPVGKHLELSAGLDVPILVALDQPHWGDDGDVPVNVAGAGYATYRDEALTGKVVVLLAPGVGARWAF